MKIVLIILTLALFAATSANAYFILKSKSDKNGETGKTAVTTTTDKKLTTTATATATKKAAAPQNNLPQQGSAGGKTSTTPNAAQPGKSEKMGASSSGITPAKNEDADKKQDSPSMSTIAKEVEKNKKNKK
ncbi:MAG: hypothetical protein LBG46_04565 [Elusimicrobiota bacterium]|jgi:hypothetical protein|nr:hypothetical protein [Elusimicrobiota bacterium]